MFTSLDEIQTYRSNHMNLLGPLREDKHWGFDLPWSVFATGVSMLSSQQYGVRIQQRAIRDFGWSPISLFRDLGDAGDRIGGYYEIKSSILTESNTKMNLVQIRPWQQVMTAILVFDLRNGGCVPYLFVLSKSELDRECALIGAASAHGTRTANAHNQNIEYRMSLNVDPNDLHFARWCRLYRRHGTVLDL